MRIAISVGPVGEPDDTMMRKFIDVDDTAGLRAVRAALEAVARTLGDVKGIVEEQTPLGVFVELFRF